MKNCRIIFLLNRLNFYPRLKSVLRMTARKTVRNSNRKTYTRIEVNFDKRGSVMIYLKTPTRHMANWGLRSPPLLV
jgi:hypothetical protein